MPITTLVPGVLTVAVYYEFGPFAENSNSGSDITYIRQFAQENGLKINFLEQSKFDNIWRLPGEGKCDMAVGGITYFQNRKNTGTVWSSVYFYNPRSFLIRKNDTLNGPEDLTNKTVSVTAADLADEEFLTVEDLEAWITKYDIKDVNIIYAKDEKVSAQMVLDGKSFATGAGYLINRYLASLPEFEGLKLAWVHNQLLSDGKQIAEGYEYPVREASTGLVDALNTFIKTNQYIKYPDPPPVLRKYDSVVKGNVDIKQLSEKKYKITFNKIGKFLEYQNWSNSQSFSQRFNKYRVLNYLKAKQWVQAFFRFNEYLLKAKNTSFNPTVVMEICNNKYLFVIDKVKLNGNCHVVFKVSTKEIESSDKKRLKLPLGRHDRVRFDIEGAF
jgi:ABC-type amino acid transport substrate-binding protein